MFGGESVEIKIRRFLRRIDRRNSLDSFSNYETLFSEGVGGLCSTWLPSNKEIRIRGGKGNGNKSAIRCGNR